ncbi:hypothetical protein CONCODRAFT_79818 [Conidiobolus coronatus NRRL 28638]|uniref:DNA-directed RNA polymerase III subunit RPC10 n=1 Tax=Conidiobolus coronatus (strain ATCC 28846 / CBS 209.66 / NRRL 28638) TaxID=796925 RepID=A0A137NZW7_CONC2|nr:hypothetical protein CONCODRAFT_79818 [Conidiobolus coronatus NRRL 28638]|eukprot:KXN68248.1 hypothetical protein CONCODRAFT_79818 [Conidiobolus coronatus NRRL 28638]
MLTVSKKGTHHFICNTCPYQYPISHSMVGRTHMKRKEVDDVLGGEAAWANVDATDVPCPKCEHTRAYFFQLQIRSADEPMTTFYKCCNQDCGNQWKE